MEAVDLMKWFSLSVADPVVVFMCGAKEMFALNSSGNKKANCAHFVMSSWPGRAETWKHQSPYKNNPGK